MKFDTFVPIAMDLVPEPYCTRLIQNLRQKAEAEGDDTRPSEKYFAYDDAEKAGYLGWLEDHKNNVTGFVKIEGILRDVNAVQATQAIPVTDITEDKPTSENTIAEQPGSEEPTTVEPPSSEPTSDQPSPPESEPAATAPAAPPASDEMDESGDDNVVKAPTF